MNEAERNRCDARFSMETSPLADRVWCMGDSGHEGRHWITDTHYEIRWDDRIAFRPWERP